MKLAALESVLTVGLALSSGVVGEEAEKGGEGESVQSDSPLCEVIASGVHSFFPRLPASSVELFRSPGGFCCIRQQGGELPSLSYVVSCYPCGQVDLEEWYDSVRV